MTDVTVGVTFINFQLVRQLSRRFRKHDPIGPAFLHNLVFV